MNEKDGRVLSRMTHYQVTANLEALERWGRIDERGFRLLRSDKELNEQIGKLVLEKLCPPTEIDLALLSIMDDNDFFGPADWLRYYNERVEDYDLPISIEKLNNILEEDCPFTRGKKIRDTHFLFYLPKNFHGNPLTIMKWQEIYPKSRKSTDKESFCGFSGYIDAKNKDYHDSLAVDCTQKNVARNNWYLMPKNLPKILGDKTFLEQAMDKPDTYGIARLIECVPIYFLYFEKTGGRVNTFSLTSPFNGNTSDVDSRKETIRVGTFSESGVDIIDGYTIRCTPLGHGSIFLFRKLE